MHPDFPPNSGSGSFFRPISAKYVPFLISHQRIFPSGRRSHQLLIKELRTTFARFSFYRQLFSAIFGVKPQKVLGRFVEVLVPPSQVTSKTGPSRLLQKLPASFPTALMNDSLDPATAELFSDDEITKIVRGRECPRSASPRPGVRRETLGCDPKPESAAVDSGGPITLQYFIKFGANVERRT
jgi:hypothetical protein